MINSQAIESYLTRRPAAGAAAYVAMLGLLVVAIIMSVQSCVSRWRAVANATDHLARLEQRLSAGVNDADRAVPDGAVFLQGDTITVAGAALLQRVSESINRSGGNLISSQVDLQEAKSEQGYLSLTANCDIDQGSLQGLLYDIESGLPFLFVDQLFVQPKDGSGGEQQRMQVMIKVSGLWEQKMSRR